MRNGKAPGVDALIVTALQLERAAVRRHLADVIVLREDGVVADTGQFAAGTTDLTVLVIETGPGNVSAALAVGQAVAAWRPSLVIMCGVAGGLKDVTIGDVVAASKVYWVEGGKEGPGVRPRPDQAPVSAEMVQLARTVAGGRNWISRAAGTGGGDWAAAGQSPAALVGPIAAGERVLADRAARTTQLIAESYGDSLCVAMEDFGALRAAAAGGVSQTLAVRGISDLLRDKAATDASGAQPLAAANAAAFVFEVLALLADLSPVAPRPASDSLLEVAVELYPQGPLQDAVWARAGGDVSRLPLSGSGRTQWWHALQLVKNGGGNVGEADLLRVFAADYPANPGLTRNRRQGQT